MICRRLRRLLWWSRPGDPVIDQAIAQNRATFIAGMSKQDARLTDRLGEKTWQETIRAQRRVRQGSGDRVVAFRKGQG